jgi:hypothetical protein
MGNLKSQAVYLLHLSRLYTPPFHLEKRQGKVAQGGAQEDRRRPTADCCGGEDLYGIGPLNAQAQGGHIGIIPHLQAPL